MFAISPCERCTFYQAIQDVLAKCESSGVLDISTSVVFLYMMEAARSGTSSERNLVQRVVEVEYHVTSLGAILRCARYGRLNVWLIFGWCLAVVVAVLCWASCGARSSCGTGWVFVGYSVIWQ